MQLAGKNIHYSNGNLLISGEYFVLIGAKALAIPLKYGQQMSVEPVDDDKKTIHWVTYELDNRWFEAKFNSDNLEILYSNDLEKAFWLQNLLQRIKKNNPETINNNKSFRVTCEIQFNTQWGWGSSSSLICNLASWAGTDPFTLHKTVAKGSGYDIAASLSNSPIFFQIIEEQPEIVQARFNPAFRDSIHFVHLGMKQNTEKSIISNYKSILRSKQEITAISELTEKIAKEENLHEFMRHIAEHEKIVSKALNMTRIKDSFFSDFNGEIKSLGSWGGDFVLAASHLEEEKVRQYFYDKGLKTIFRFDEITRNYTECIPQ